MATVTLTNIRKSFGSLRIIDDLSLDIADKEFLVLLGPSGCGKTTTMRMIAGLEDPTSGDILIDGARVNDKPARDRDLAMVFQNYGLYPHMTVENNIGYPLKVKGLSWAARQPRIAAAAEKVELGALLQRKPAALSGGQRQRVALARAIVRTPRLFLMDEPLSNLDAKLRTLMRAQLKHLQRELATTTIYVTHDQVEAMTLADRIVIMNKGRIEQQGSPAEVYARPTSTFVAGFIGSPPMNLIPGSMQGGSFNHSAGRLNDLPDGLQGDLTLGQRPEDLRLAPPSQADFAGSVFSSELLGDSTLVAVQLGKEIVNVKTGPTEGQVIGAPIGIVFDRAKLHFFDTASGQRVEASIR
ncbi:ABC transporter ATP-binding protein [Labrys miyagiensis]|uniref:ABC transporter ATP-binding protein n=1 Tax=Labrys miyagiensis TaxID=346912 RepID=A0ABQ6CV96_9HYPH|nr:sn-glycerol-3-phosphate ABC transporter ATP-binding protein UgpC [Labrys miyagiensis]GLS22176.1 ABC transporter ATP-binding protein [Labrys miyagiensis]